MEILIGRSTKNDIVLKDATAENFHALAKIIDKDHIEIFDKDTKYGTYFQGNRFDRKVIQYGENIQIGFTNISFEDVYNEFVRKNNLSFKQPVGHLHAIKNEHIEPEIKSTIHSFKITEFRRQSTNLSDFTDNIQKKKSFETDVANNLKSNHRKPKGNLTIVLYVLIPLVILGSYLVGMLMASKHKIALTADSYQSFVPSLPVISNAFSINPLFENCFKQQSFLEEVHLSLPEKMITSEDTSVSFKLICDDFDQVKNHVEDFKISTLNKMLLVKNIQLSLVRSSLSKQLLAFVYIGSNNQFSVKHYINKRYQLGSKSSYDADIKIIKDHQSRQWMILDPSAAYPGKSTLHNKEKGILYRFDLDRCEKLELAY